MREAPKTFGRAALGTTAISEASGLQATSRLPATQLLTLVPLALGHFALGDLAAARHVGEQARDVARRFGNAPAVELLTRHLDAPDAASASTT